MNKVKKEKRREKDDAQEKKKEFKMEFEPIKKPDEYKKEIPSKEEYINNYYSQEWSLDYFKLK